MCGSVTFENAETQTCRQGKNKDLGILHPVIMFSKLGEGCIVTLCYSFYIELVNNKLINANKHNSLVQCFKNVFRTMFISISFCLCYFGL